MFSLYKKQTNSTLCELDSNERSYILNTNWRIHYIYNDLAQLIAHPHQRITQSNANYNLKEPDVVILSDNKPNELSSSPEATIPKILNTIRLENDSSE